MFSTHVELTYRTSERRRARFANGVTLDVTRENQHAAAHKPARGPALVTPLT
jgi:hypothetical protein